MLQNRRITVEGAPYPNVQALFGSTPRRRERIRCAVYSEKELVKSQGGPKCW